MIDCERHIRRHLGRHGGNRQAAFTLIEVLLALALAGIVVSAAGRLAVQSLITTRTVQRAVNDRRRVEFITQMIRRDVQARTDEPVAVTLDPNHRPVITIPCLAAFPTDALHVPRRPAVVTYRLVRADAVVERYALRREVVDCTRPRAAPLVQTLSSEVTGLDIELFRDERWQPLDSRATDNRRPIEAFRIALALENAESVIRRTFVIAGFEEAWDASK